MDYEEVFEGINERNFLNCIYLKEFQRIKEAVKLGFSAKNIWMKEITGK